jgi:hypothetical protein
MSNTPSPSTFPSFSIPLNHQQFVAALHKGHGRALMHVRAVGLSDLKDSIVDACLHARAYDPQCDGDRSRWLIDLVDACGPGSGIEAILVEQADALTDEFWDAMQRCAILRELVRRGHSGARASLYRCLREWPDCGNVIGVDELIEIDGDDGLIHVAEFLGGLLEGGIDRCDDDPICAYDGTRGEGAARRLLDDVAPNSPRVASYLNQLDRNEAEIRQARSEPQKRIGEYSASEIMPWIAAESGPLVAWGRDAPIDEVQSVFDAMMSESEPTRLRHYLRVFQQRALPVIVTRLLRLAAHEDSEIRRRANTALSMYAHPAVRALAVERLRTARTDEHELKLLAKNFQAGDSSLVEPVLRVRADTDECHDLVYQLAEVCTANPVVELATTMHFVYEHSPCSNCRRRAVQSLIAINAAPAWLLEECRHDSSEQTRALVAVGPAQ